MAGEITYEVVEARDNMLTVKYSLGEHSMLMFLPTFGAEGIDAHIQRHAPREMLKGMAKPKVDLAALIGMKGVADLEEKSAATSEVAAPAESPATEQQEGVAPPAVPL
jgi:hypothetical protein